MPGAETSRRPVFNFTSDPSTSSFAVSAQTYLSNHPSAYYQYIATGALVFDRSSPSSSPPGPRILLIQRAEGDSMPGRWEIPGGGCDDDDASILHAVARELWEEAGLQAARVGPLVGTPHVFVSRSGKLVGKFNFLVEAAGEPTADGRWDVTLDPVEHQRFVWASEEEVRARRAVGGDVELSFTARHLEETVLEAFRLRREESGGEGEEGAS
jgi:8-oxo-dGTP pyrophosphatase MutT (NUDIX family)